MPIAYSCISRRDVILVDKTIGAGNYQQNVKSVLTDLSFTVDRKTTLPYDEWVFKHEFMHNH